MAVTGLTQTTAETTAATLLRASGASEETVEPPVHARLRRARPRARRVARRVRLRRPAAEPRLRRPSGRAGSRASGRLPIVAKSIADHVGPNYKFDSGDQLVAVVPSPPAVTAGTQNVSITAVSMQSQSEREPERPRSSGSEQSEMYTLCGLGNRCSIATGKPTESPRPPRPPRRARAGALHVQARSGGRLRPRLHAAGEGVHRDRPRSSSSGATSRAGSRSRSRTRCRLRPPPPAGQDDPTEGPLIDALTLPHLFVTQLIQLQVGGALLALMPVAF